MQWCCPPASSCSNHLPPSNQQSHRLLLAAHVPTVNRVVVTDHGSFVLYNVYVPNAGERPDRVRLAAKLSFLQALKNSVDELLGAGRQASARVNNCLW